MADDKPLSDDEAYALIHAALLELGSAPGHTVRADTAIKAARRSLLLLQMGLIQAIEHGSDDLISIKGPGEI